MIGSAPSPLCTTIPGLRSTRQRSRPSSPAPRAGAGRPCSTRCVRAYGACRDCAGSSTDGANLPPMSDGDVDGFLALLAARRAPRTVEAYRRDLTALAGFLGKPVADATVEDLERYTAQLRADGLPPATIARRAAAARSFFRHQQLLGARDDNPAAAVRLPRRGRTLPRTLSAGEAARLIEAANGVAPRALRDRALVELLYGAGLRVSEAVNLARNGVDLDDRLVRVIGKGDKERVV